MVHTEHAEKQVFSVSALLRVTGVKRVTARQLYTVTRAFGEGTANIDLERLPH